MSTYASAIVVDADTADGAQAALVRLRAQPDFDEDAAIVTGPERRGNLHRLAVYAPFFAVSSDLGDELLADVTNGRALAADDFDEYGARFTAGISTSWQTRVDSRLAPTSTTEVRPIAPGGPPVPS
ncbi:hypothetical protein [Desertimonas flava]|uniref:hypothetical protein n=1 Tax=Desertimonas flava TaxID=2064846 RepID=UPI000E35257B|nr:hypothetical protein [Desertimonas flava]